MSESLFYNSQLVKQSANPKVLISNFKKKINKSRIFTLQKLAKGQAILLYCLTEGPGFKSTSLLGSSCVELIG